MNLLSFPVMELKKFPRISWEAIEIIDTKLS